MIVLIVAGIVIIVVMTGVYLYTCLRQNDDDPIEIAKMVEEIYGA